jgi:hypothetical protein
MRLNGVGGDVGQRDAIAGRVKAFGDDGAEPACGAGDEDDSI